MNYEENKKPLESLYESAYKCRQREAQIKVIKTLLSMRGTFRDGDLLDRIQEVLKEEIP